jgi:hypothetical protein
VVSRRCQRSAQRLPSCRSGSVVPKPRGWWWAVFSFLFLPSLAMGTEVEVSYLIARTAVNRSVPDGTAITFTLHSDATCSSPPIRTVVTQLKDIAIHDVLREASVTSRGRPLNALRLVAKFQEVDHPDEAPFVRATGPGIFPAGAACQVWHRAGRGTVHNTAAELRERMIPAGAARAKPPGAEAMPGTEAAEKARRP